ncbi:MAG: hypothetical protein ACREGI_01160 [Candidatus Levyibacteriota bacterium]
MVRPPEFMQPSEWTQRSIDYAVDVRNQREMQALIQLLGINKAVFLLGQYKVGKTTLAGAVSQQLETTGNYETIFTTPPEFIDGAQAIRPMAFGDVEYKPFNPATITAIDSELAQGMRVLLIIDEVSTTPPGFVHELRLRNYLANPNVSFLLIGQGNMQTPNVTAWTNLFAGQPVGTMVLPLP